MYTPRIENPDGRKVTCTAQSAKGARTWSELFIPNTPNERIQAKNRTTSLEEDIFSPGNAVVGSKTIVQSNVVVQNSAGVQNRAGAQNSTSMQQVPQNQVVMAGLKEKLPKFNGDGTADPIRHYKTCKTIWTTNGVTDMDDWVRQFPTILRDVAIDWFADTDPQKLTT